MVNFMMNLRILGREFYLQMYLNVSLLLVCYWCLPEARDGLETEGWPSSQNVEEVKNTQTNSTAPSKHIIVD